MKAIFEVLQKLALIGPVTFLIGCTNVLIKEPIGEFVTADEMEFGVYIDAEAQRYLLEETEDPMEFLVTELPAEEGESWRFKYSKLERNNDLDVELGWFYHEEHDAWAVVRIIRHGESATNFCMVMPHPKALKRERKTTHNFKLIEHSGDYDTTYLVEGKMKKNYWKRDSSWYFGAVMMYHKESEIRKLLEAVNGQHSEEGP